MKIVLTSDWSFEQLAPYTKDITAAMQKLRDKFPREVDVQHLANEIITGKRQLWLILNDDDSFVSFVLSEIQTNNATGLKTIVVPSMAGDDGPASVPLIAEIEKYGLDQGCDKSAVYGRWGWKRELTKEGYSLEMCIFGKPLK